MPTDQEVKNRIRKLYEIYPDLVLEAILESPRWPTTLQTCTAYTRNDDETQKGAVTVQFSHDGDGWIDIVSTTDPDDPYTHRFRNWIGGGKSLHVSTALRILAFAINLDNEQDNQKKTLEVAIQP